MGGGGPGEPLDAVRPAGLGPPARGPLYSALGSERAVPLPRLEDAMAAYAETRAPAPVRTRLTEIGETP